MGLYDTVWVDCNKEDCSGHAWTQTKVLDSCLRDYFLNIPEDLADRLSSDDILALAEDVKDEFFSCDKCENRFVPFRRESIEDKVKLAKDLFGQVN